MKYFLFSIFLFVLTGCGGGGSNSSTPAASAVFNLQCDLSVSYTPASSPVVSVGTGTPATTVIAVHGKNGSPIRSFMQTLSSDLNAQGYDVIMPYMPWSGLVWSGTLCDGISYINSLVVAEKAKGRKVILLGHSLAGPVVLSYSALSDTSKPNAINIVAPGHFIHQSSVLANAHASSITLANTMISNGQGNMFATFQTYNNGAPVNISATPIDYLSMHDTNQFPDIKATTPLVSLPLLWLAGQTDPLTNVVNFFGIVAFIPSAPANVYQVIPGDHFTVLGNVTGVLDPWYQGLP